jgi:6-pyruvoyl-tetrahydropterin synthase
MTNTNKSKTSVYVDKAAFRFNAAHFMIHMDENGKTEREKLHGHNYKVLVKL